MNSPPHKDEGFAPPYSFGAGMLSSGQSLENPFLFPSAGSGYISGPDLTQPKAVIAAKDAAVQSPCNRPSVVHPRDSAQVGRPWAAHIFRKFPQLGKFRNKHSNFLSPATFFIDFYG
jgi:hypothetical protein